MPDLSLTDDAWRTVREDLRRAGFKLEGDLVVPAEPEQKSVPCPTGHHDPVNHPSHYTAYKGLEVIDLTEQMNFNRGNAVKYICRAGFKDPEAEDQDLEKAIWYLQRELQRLKKLDEQP